MKMGPQPMILTLNMRKGKRKTFTMKASPIKSAMIRKLADINKRPVCQERPLETGDGKEIDKYQRKIELLVGSIVSKSSIANLKTDSASSMSNGLEIDSISQFNFSKISESCIKAVSEKQTILPTELFSALELCSDKLGTPVLMGLLSWCCLYIHYCNRDIANQFTGINFKNQGWFLYNEIRHLIDSSNINLVSTNFVLSFLLLLDDDLTSQHNRIIVNDIHCVKQILGTVGQSELKIINENVRLTMMSYLLYFDLTSFYSACIGTIFSQKEFISYFSTTPFSAPLVRYPSQMEVCRSLLKLYYDISRISCLVNVANEVGDLEGLLIEAKYLEKQLDSTVFTSPSGDRLEEKKKLFEFFKETCRLYIYQCLYHRQSLSIESMLVCRRLLSQVPSVLKSEYCQSMLIFPFFILSVDLVTMETRSWMIHQYCLLYERTRYPGIKQMVDLLKKIWKFNPDGNRYVFWPGLACRDIT